MNKNKKPKICIVKRQRNKERSKVRCKRESRMQQRKKKDEKSLYVFLNKFYGFQSLFFFRFLPLTGVIYTNTIYSHTRKYRTHTHTHTHTLQHEVQTTTTTIVGLMMPQSTATRETTNLKREKMNNQQQPAAQQKQQHEGEQQRQGQKEAVKKCSCNVLFGYIRGFYAFLYNNIFWAIFPVLILLFVKQWFYCCFDLSKYLFKKCTFNF